MNRIRKRLTYANVMSSLAVFLVLGGATAIAATHIPGNSIGTKQLQKAAVHTGKIKNEAVNASKIADNNVTTAKIANGNVTTAKLAEGGVTNSKLADGGVTNSKLANESVTGSKLKTSTIGTVPSATTATNLSGYSRTGWFRVVATPVSSAEEGYEKAPHTKLFSAGPLTIYAQCYSYETRTEAATSIETSENGVIFSSEENSLEGSEQYLDTNTPANERTLNEENGNGNNARLSEPESTPFLAMAPDGTAVLGNTLIATKHGTIGSGPGLYGEGNTCLFAGDITTFGG